ncbi:molybdate ABC transporter substrate-binding protein [Endozoicomonas sp. 4G]|uniref:molybdate ABC transporter substrate-binding protein n=1 Tax=Endozoicomonas sp. 4G TaxID=2872754 RepID=UPI00207870D2|nr:molybdate ABC transporter substrate-binding protein [Endozoicomonas sp. 4G]
MFHFRFVKKTFFEYKAIPELPIMAFILGCLLSISPPSGADTIKVAVASNFFYVLETLKVQFESRFGHTLELTSYGSSGDLKRAISNNTDKIDLFLSADNIRTAELEQEGKVLENSRKIYAQGLLAFWHGQNVLVEPDDIKTFIIETNPPAIHIADPLDAPYGHAAKSVLEKYGLYQTLKDQNKLVIRIFVELTWRLIKDSTSVGFVPASLVMGTNSNGNNRINLAVGATLVPQKLYTPLLQELVILKDTEHEAAARTFVDYLLSDEVQAFIAANGYKRAPVQREEGSSLVLSGSVSIHKRQSSYPKAAMVIIWLNTALWMLSGA